MRCTNKIILVFFRFRGARKYSGGGEGGHVFETMHTVLKLRLESGSYGSETSFRRCGFFNLATDFADEVY